MVMAIKLLISGFENSGKTTLISGLQDALIINCDKKKFSGKVAHANYEEWMGIDHFSKFVNAKISNYKTKFNKLPTFVVFDTITQLYTDMTRYNNKYFKGYEIHSQNNRDTLNINAYIENTLLAETDKKPGINVIILAHVTVDKEGRYTIPAQGQFRDSGGWLSVVNEAIFIERTKEKHIIHLKSDMYPARTLLEVSEATIPMKDFNLQEHCNKLIEFNEEYKDFEL